MEQSKFYQIKNITEQEYTLVGCDGSVITRPILDVDKSASAFTIQDAKDGDVLCYKDEISLYRNDIKNCTKQETTFGGFVFHCCYDGKIFITDNLYSLTEQDKKDIHPATKEQRDALEKAMTNLGYVFDFEKKELKKIEQNPAKEYSFNIESGLFQQLTKEQQGLWRKEVEQAYNAGAEAQKPSEWSEEDERCLTNAIDACKQMSDEDYDYSQGYIDAINWLKSLKGRAIPKQEILEKLKEWLGEYVSDLADVDTATLIGSFSNYLDGKLPKTLRPQKQWKPSDEQLKSLKEVIDVGHFTSYPNALETLYEQLKKLIEEDV